MKNNILLIILDSVRARNLSLYGHNNRTTPFIDRFQKERGTQYSYSWAPSTWSLPSHVSMFSGYHVGEHNISTMNDKINPEEIVFKKLDGYQTSVFSGNTWLTEIDCGLKDGFDDVQTNVALPYPDALTPNDFVLEEGEGNYSKYIKKSLSHDKTFKSALNGVAEKLKWDYPNIYRKWIGKGASSERYVDELLHWLENTDGNWAACVNLMDAHLPYRPSPEFNNWGDRKLLELQQSMDDSVWEFYGGQRKWWQRNALEGLYDGCIREMDDAVERIVQYLSDNSLLDETMVIITADHGEAFGEFDPVTGRRTAAHAAGISEEILHVPLVINYPNQDSSKICDEPVSLTAIHDLILSASEESTDKIEDFDVDVVSQHPGMEEPMKKRALKYVDDIDEFDSPGNAKYYQENGNILKISSWGENFGIKQVIKDSQCNWISDTMDESFKINSDNKNVNIGNNSRISKSTKERLENLGYR